MRYVLLACALLAIPVRSECGPITYNIREVRFFGGAPDPSRDLSSSGAFLPGTNVSVPVTYSTGGPSPVTFAGNGSAQQSPLELRAANTVVAQTSTALQFNTAPFDDTTLVTLVQPGLSESGVMVTGGSGIGYLLPQFRVDGTFSDSHVSAFGRVSMCAGISSCNPDTLGTSSAGVQVLDVTFMPAVGSQTAFTFGTPFQFFFFLTSGISSTPAGTLGAGSVSADFRVQLLGFSVVDANGQEIPGAVVHSDLAPVPEPALGALLLLALTALRRRRQ